MKKLVFIAAALLTMTAANAKIWRVNFEHSENADFKTLSEATESSDFQAGDSIYVEPGYHRGTYSQNYIKKNCTVIGPGWGFKNSVNGLSEIESAYFTTSINISYPTDSVALYGLYLTGEIVADETLNHAIVERCHFWMFKSHKIRSLRMRQNIMLEGINLHKQGSDAMLQNGEIVGNIILKKFMVVVPHTRLLIDHNTIILQPNSTIGYVAYLQYIYSMNTQVSNNILIFQSTNGTDQGDNIFPTGTEPYDQNWPIYNNYISFHQSTVEAAQAQSDTKYDHIANNNTLDATMANTFVGTVDPGIVDGAMYYYVQDDSPAKTADENGGECGAFGGEYPYVLCGRPLGVPYLYDINVPQHTTNNNLHVTFKVAGNNE